MKKLLFAVLLFSVAGFAQTPQCRDYPITTTGRTLLDLPAPGMEQFGSAGFTYRTSGVASLSFTIEAGPNLATVSIPGTKISAQTTLSTGSPPTIVDAGVASGSYRHWYANVATLNAGTLTLTGCFSPGNVSRAVVGPSGLSAGQAVGTNASKQLVSEPTYYADQFSGADWGAKVLAAGAALCATYTTGGVIDSRGITGAQSNATEPFGSNSCPLVVLVGAATITSSVALRPYSNDHIIGLGQGVSTIKRAASFSPSFLINFDFNSANDASIENLTIDGNRANVTSAGPEIYISGARDTVRSVTVQHSASQGVGLNYQATYATIQNSRFTDINSMGILTTGGTPGIAPSYHLIANNTLDSWGGYGIGIVETGSNVISGNNLTGTQVLANVDTTNVANSVVTCHSCTSFGTLAVGMYVAIGATRYVINTVTDTSHVTVTGNFGALTNQAALLGGLEPINVDSSSNNAITGNVTYKGSDCGIVLNASNGGPANFNTVVGNTVSHPAYCGIANDGGSGTVAGNTITGNTVVDARQYAGAPGGGDVGVILNSSGSVNNLVSDNVLYDDQGGSATEQYAVAFDSVGAGNKLGPNTASGQVVGYFRGTTTSLGGWLNTIRSYCTGTVGSAETDFLNGAACSGATTSTAKFVIASAGSIAGLQVNMGTAVKAAASGVAATVLVNGSASTITCTVATNTKVCSDTSHVVAVAAGDLVTFQLGATNATDTAANVGMAVSQIN